MSYFGKFLLIENDGKLLDALMRDKSLVDQYPSTLVKTMPEAVGLLDRVGPEIRMIFLSEQIAQLFDPSPLIEMAEKLRISLILLETKEPTSARKKFSRSIPAPKSYQDLVSVVMKDVKGNHDWSKTQNDGVEKDRELSALDEKYIEVRVKDLLITPKSFFNFYLRLSAGKYIKVFNAGDSLTSEEVERYFAKGIEEFYVPKEEHEKFVRLQGTLSSQMINSDASHGRKVKSLMKLGAGVTNNLIKCGITPDRLDNAQMFLDQSVTLLKHMKMKNEVITNFLKNINENEHSAAVAFIAGLLANHLGFESSKSIKVVGAAALLHDIGLYDLDPDFVEGEEQTDDKKREIFERHASHGADLLRQSGAFEEVICHAVENHHRRRQGGQASRRSSSVNLATEIVSVADEFFSTVIRKGSTPDQLLCFLEIELKNYSPQVERAFQILTKGKKAA